MKGEHKTWKDLYMPEDMPKKEEHIIENCKECMKKQRQLQRQIDELFGKFRLLEHFEKRLEFLEQRTKWIEEHIEWLVHFHNEHTKD